MKRRIAILSTALGLIGSVSGCHGGQPSPVALSSNGTETSSWPYGCSPQAPAVYRLTQSPAMGTLEVQVLDAAGLPVAGREVVVYYNDYTGYRCPSQATSTTDAAGLARFERLRTGPYVIRAMQAGAENASGQEARIEAGLTTSVTLQSK